MQGEQKKEPSVRHKHWDAERGDNSGGDQPYLWGLEREQADKQFQPSIEPDSGDKPIRRRTGQAEPVR